MNVSDLFSVKNKTVLVTGGSSGIGLMLATGFVENGARVYVCSIMADDCDRIAEELTSRGPGECISLPADLLKMSDIEKLVETIKNREPDGLDVLINNAGIMTVAPIDSYTEADFDNVLNLNLKSVFFVSQKFIPLLEKKGTASDPSRIINTGSVSGIAYQENVFAYSASKAGLHHLSKSMAVSLGPRHITVNCIAPGIFPSLITKEFLERDGENIAKLSLMGRIGRPNDIVGACIYLASKAGSYITGTILVVDGGLSITT
ncbi:hypothetical protein BB560_001848 [Smittium megazygosporum]|uniref:Gluconate 5-dehydrogenase n=1 Tax=Smittium megazygosporum TaxID=133381 RepID=A0A2T9ZGD7_9FUNG|nr:hypothetical protein BB560_001848 [Smittium megazygosporum]